MRYFLYALGLAVLLQVSIFCAVETVKEDSSPVLPVIVGVSTVVFVAGLRGFCNDSEC